jgi:hypothetical protein
MSTQPIIVEVDMGSASSRGRPPDQAWMARLRHGDRSVGITIGLSRSAADHLARHIVEASRPRR